MEGEAPESMEVEPETSITLPMLNNSQRATHLQAGTMGWIHTHPETAIQSIATLFSLLNGRKTEKRITGYNKFTGIVLSGDEYIYDLDLLKGSGKLPEKAELVYEYGEESTVEVDIKGWQGGI